MQKMKRKLLLFPLIFVFFFVQYALADDGTQVLDPDVITNQTAGKVSASDFPIRAELFSESLTKKEQQQMKAQTKIVEQLHHVDFKQKQLSTLYTANYETVQQRLFKSYSGSALISNHSNRSTSSNKAMIIMAVITLPLLILTIFAAKRFARRKRKNERTY